MIGVTTGADRDAIMVLDDITFTPQCVKFNGTIPTIPPTTTTTTVYTEPSTTTTTTATVYTEPSTTTTTTAVYTEPPTTTTTITGTTTTPRGKDDFFYKNKIV